MIIWLKALVFRHEEKNPEGYENLKSHYYLEIGRSKSRQSIFILLMTAAGHGPRHVKGSSSLILGHPHRWV